MYFFSPSEGLKLKCVSSLINDKSCFFSWQRRPQTAGYVTRTATPQTAGRASTNWRSRTPGAPPQTARPAANTSRVWAQVQISLSLVRASVCQQPGHLYVHLFSLSFSLSLSLSLSLSVHYLSFSIFAKLAVSIS